MGRRLITAMMGVATIIFNITIIAAFYNISGNPMVDAAFGYKTKWWHHMESGRKLFKSAINSRNIILLICTLVLLLFTSIHPVIIMVVVALLVYLHSNLAVTMIGILTLKGNT